MNEVQNTQTNNPASEEDRMRQIERVTEMMKEHATDADAIGIITILPKRIKDEDGNDSIGYTLFTSTSMAATLSVIVGVFESELDNVQKQQNSDLTSTH